MMFSRPVEWIFLLLVPVCTVWLMSHLLTETLDTTHIPVVVVDEDRTAYSGAVVDRLHQLEQLQVTLADREAALRTLRTREAEAVFVLEEGFQARVVDGSTEQIVKLYQSPVSVTSGLLSESVAGEVMRLVSNVKAADETLLYMDEFGLRDRVGHEEAAEGGRSTASEDAAAEGPAGSEDTVSPDAAAAALEPAPYPAQRSELWEEAWRHTDAQWEPEPLMGMHYEEWSLGEAGRSAVETAASGTESGNAGNGYTDMERGAADPSPARAPERQLLIINGVLGTVLLFIAFCLCNGLLQEKEQGLWRRIASTPSGLRHYLIYNGLAIGSAVFLVGMLTTAWAMVYTGIGFGELFPFFTTVSMLILLMLYTVVCTLAGLALVTYVHSRGQLFSGCLFIVLVTAVFGDSLLLLNGFGGWWTQGAPLTPQHWLFEGMFNQLYGRNSSGGPSGWLPFLVLGLMGGCLLMFTSWRIRRLKAR
jgi:hypothetical protein